MYHLSHRVLFMLSGIVLLGVVSCTDKAVQPQNPGPADSLTFETRGEHELAFQVEGTGAGRATYSDVVDEGLVRVSGRGLRVLDDGSEEQLSVAVAVRVGPAGSELVPGNYAETGAAPRVTSRLTYGYANSERRYRLDEIYNATTVRMSITDVTASRIRGKVQIVAEKQFAAVSSNGRTEELETQGERLLLKGTFDLPLWRR